MKRLPYYLTLALFFGCILNFCGKDLLGQEKEGKITSSGYWIHEKVEEIPGMQRPGPFVRLEDGGILTVGKNMCYISKDGGETWTKYPIFSDKDSSRFDMFKSRALIRTSSGVIILGFRNDKEKANWNWRSDILDSPGAIDPTYTIRSLDGGKPGSTFRNSMIPGRG